MRTRNQHHPLLHVIVGLMLLLAGSFAQAGTVHYYYTDPQGTPLAKTDANGTIIASYDYTPYGTAVTSMSGAPGGPGYTGHVNDPDTGLVYMQQRYYDPVVGRFINKDPAGIQPGSVFNFNRFVYGNNNPIANIDPTGMQDCSDQCMKMRALSDHFSNMAAGISDENAATGMSAEGSGDWAHPGQNPTYTEGQKDAAAGGAYIIGQIADTMSDFESFANSELNGETPSVSSTFGVFTTLTPVESGDERGFCCRKSTC